MHKWGHKEVGSSKAEKLMLFKYYLYHILDSRELAESRQSFRESLEDVRSDTKVDYKWFLKGAKDSQG